ncbi:MAG: hypothetical protein ACR2ID_05570 [Chthoniobacterales bacterium]
MKKSALHFPLSPSGEASGVRQRAALTRRVIAFSLVGISAALLALTVHAQQAQKPNATADSVPLPRTHTLVGSPAIYQGFEPCRVIDTRNANSAFGGPKLVAGATRTFDLDVAGIAGLCINTFPPGVKAMVVNVTLVNEDGPGFVTIYPGNGTQPLASSINSSGPNTVIGNEIVMPLAPDGTIKIFTSVGTHLVMDLVGIFTNNLAPDDNLFVTGNIGTGNGNGMIEAYNSSTTTTAVGVRGVMSSAAPGTFSAGVRGISNSTTGNGIGVWGSQAGSGYGVYGTTNGGRGVYGTAGAGVGVYGTTATGTGVRGDATNGGFAGFFLGDVTVLGTLSKSAGTFKIDHPADPANKYLSHSFIESPDMMNIYNGNVTTNAKGEAVVTMPEYFSALNKDFRYQLTPVGSFAQAMVAKEIAQNKFVIKTNKPNVKVSWQITGIRHDAYADAHRVQVEEEKQGVERGAYLNPEVFGQPADKGIAYLRGQLQETEKNAAQTASAQPASAGGN